MNRTLIIALVLCYSVICRAQFNVCGDTNIPGTYVTRMVLPSVTDSRITGKNASEHAYVSTNAPRRNQLVVFFPGTGGVPASFDNFCQNAADLGFHALALTYDNDTSEQDFCGSDPDGNCYYNLRYEFLTGSNTTTKTNITRVNSIEFRLAAFLNYLNTNNPAEGWGQYLVATNTAWSNALAWSKFLLAGHSQGSGYAAFIAKLHEVQRVVTFAGGDYWDLGQQPAPWNFLPSATPSERWFGFTHYFDPGFLFGGQSPKWEAQDFFRFGPMVDVATSAPPYSFSHAFTSRLEPCSNVNNQIEYHGATINDPPQVRDTNGNAFYQAVWTHMLIGSTTAPATRIVLADSVRDFSNVQASNGWRYGYWNRTSDPNGVYNVADFTLLPAYSNTLYAIPAWILSNDLQVAVWLTGARAHGVNTNACCTNRAAGPELWPVRRWLSPVSGPVTISGWLSKWDYVGGDGVTGLIKVNGTNLWSAFVEGTNAFGTNFNVPLNLATNTIVDFLVSPGANADWDGARFTAQILGAPLPILCSAPTIYARLLTNSSLELRWETCTNYDYQLEFSSTLTNWGNAGPPYAAPPGGGWLTNVVATTNGYAFFRVRADLLTNSPVPAAPGTYPNLFFTADGLLRSYNLTIPTNYNPAGSNAFALILHGHGQSADTFAALHPGLFVSAQTNNLILALADATATERGTSWNNSDPKPPGAYQVNDVSFLVALIDHIGETLALDRHRLYAGGFSSGSIMCHYLGARTMNLFAALAAVEGSIGVDAHDGVIVTNPPAAGPMPVLIVNATNDCTRPYWGGLNGDGALVTPAIAAAYYWTNANLCVAAMTATTNNITTSNIGRFNNCDNKPPPGTNQPNQVIVQRWASCVAGTEVVFVTLTDGGHEWQNAGDHVGWDSNAEVPKFFLQHARP